MSLADDRYTLRVTPTARRQLAEVLPEAVAMASHEFIVGPLLSNPDRMGKRLRPRLEDRHSARRGTYRLIYRIDDEQQTVTVVNVAHRRGADCSRNVVLAASASRLPLADGSVDAVVSTLVLCSVRSLDRALAEVRRVLRPGGRLHLVEHVAAEPGSVLCRAQGVVAPAWSRLAGGCSVLRSTRRDVLAAAGFDVSDVRSDVLPVPVPFVRPVVRGTARP